MRPPHVRRNLRTLMLCGCALAVLASSAHAAVPNAVAVSGTLRTLGGVPAPDGDYALTLRLYAGKDDQVPLFEEIVVAKVDGGLFGVTLGGGQVALPPGVFAVGGASWVGVQVGSEPELPRKPLFAVPYARHAQTAALAQQADVAAALACTGCIQPAMLDASVLAPYATKAALSAVAYTGLYQDLDGLPPLPKLATCAPGKVLAGFDPVGMPACVTDATSTYDGGDFAVSNQGCALGDVVIGIDVDGAVVCAKGSSAQVAGPQQLAKGETLKLTHGLGTLAVGVEAWREDKPGVWQPVDSVGAAGADLINVAAAANGGTCLGASSHHGGAGPNGGYGCSNAIDGVFNDAGGDSWATKGEGVGSWIELGFSQPWQIEKLRYQQRNCTCEHNKLIELVFSNGTTQQVTLAQNTSIQAFDLSPVVAQSVKINVLTVHGTTNNGATEIELLGREPAGNDLVVEKTLSEARVTNLGDSPVNVHLVVRP